MQAAEHALWTWYREWSGIARARITDRRLLRSMGFLRYRGRGQCLEAVATEPPASDPPAASTLPSREPAPALLADGVSSATP